jgi:ubiquinone/menaquinone biosynthesis C-methylase UbiE
VSPDGTLHVFDLQQEMLDHTLSAAGQLAARMHATQGDARSLPYPDATFDAAFLVTVLGEIPDPQAALRELRRVLKPGGRVVVGELAFDPHVVFPGALERHAASAGLAVEHRDGSALGYFARLRPVDARLAT